jgi:hypothetical protein
MILLNTATVVVRLENGKVIKRHIEKHYVRVHPKDREEFLKLKFVKKMRRQPLILAELPDGYQKVIT